MYADIYQYKVMLAIRQCDQVTAASMYFNLICIMEEISIEATRHKSRLSRALEILLLDSRLACHREDPR